MVEGDKLCIDDLGSDEVSYSLEQPYAVKGLSLKNGKFKLVDAAVIVLKDNIEITLNGKPIKLKLEDDASSLLMGAVPGSVAAIIENKDAAFAAQPISAGHELCCLGASSDGRYLLVLSRGSRDELIIRDMGSPQRLIKIEQLAAEQPTAEAPWIVDVDNFTVESGRVYSFEPETRCEVRGREIKLLEGQQQTEINWKSGAVKALLSGKLIQVFFFEDGLSKVEAADLATVIGQKAEYLVLAAEEGFATVEVRTGDDKTIVKLNDVGCKLPTAEIKEA